jgi:biotin operon repressor
MQYLESATEQPTLIWSEAAIESELRALEEAGVLRQIAADRGYVLVSQRG